MHTRLQSYTVIYTYLFVFSNVTYQQNTFGMTVGHY